MNDIEILEKLFSDNEKEIYSALLAKKDWLNVKLIMEGNLDYYIDSKNRKRFPFLEHLFDNVVYFSNIYYDGKNIDLKVTIDESLTKFKRAVFKNKIDLNSNCPFYVEYDFNKLDELGYRSLIANVYHMKDEKTLKINYDNIENSIVDQIKIAIIGKEDETCFILDDSNLINGCFFLPIVSKIYISKRISEDLFKELELYCNENKVELEVIYERIDNE